MITLKKELSGVQLPRQARLRNNAHLHQHCYISPGKGIALGSYMPEVVMGLN